ncbi:IS66 family transposase zinc-finger binding domain-containing protein [Pseudomonas idahonensis]|uniref:IS66 family transposase zinc-finger binding domain-containing protein n=1 Tax=Pseudomonas idahonensis TaxID=2942628 RepID=UPI0035C0E554
MIRIDTIWLAIEPMDMRAGTETALAGVIAVFGAARPHCAYLFANRRANRMKVLVHDGVGILRALAAQLIHHEPDNSHCQCGCALKRIGEDASEKLDYTPGVFTVERHIRGKWACEQCESPRGSLCLGDRPSPRRWITASNAG